MEIKRANLTRKPNYILIPTTIIKMNDENAIMFNDELRKCKKGKYYQIIRTKSGGISYETPLPAYDVKCTSSLIELTVLDKYGMYRLQFRNNIENDEEKYSLAGSNSFKKFKKLCKKYNIDLDDYIIDNGKEVKKEIEKYIIKLENEKYKDKTFIAHHIDFHSSFPSGLVATHPEFKGVIEELYNNRKTHPEYKFILNSTIGYMQSIGCCGAKWAHLSRDAINDNNKRINNLSKKLKETGRTVLAYNTDGIWYIGEIYHDENEGTTIGTWSNDHINCKVRFKSAGSYEYIENDIYTPVVRGHTNLDDMLPREKWQWGDIYLNEASPIKYGIDKDGFICKIEEE